MSSHLQLLGWHRMLLPPSLWLCQEGNRVLINCGEATQRFCTENKLRLSKVESIFLTRVSNDTVGGLLGLLLTIDTSTSNTDEGGGESCLAEDTKETTTKKCLPYGKLVEISASFGRRVWLYGSSNSSNKVLHIWGPEPLVEFFTEASQFVTFRSTSIYLHEFITHEDTSSFLPCSSISPVAVHAAESSKGKKGRKEDKSATSDVSFFVLPLSLSMKGFSPPPHKRRQMDPPVGFLTTPTDRITSTALFIGGSFPALPGRFDPKKAAALKVPKGPLFGRLKNGETIRLSDGSEVKSSDVCGPLQPAQSFLIIDLPENVSLVDEATRRIEILIKNEEPSSWLHNLTYVFHFSSDSTRNIPSYRTLQKLLTLTSATRHIKVDRSSSSDVQILPMAGTLHTLHRILRLSLPTFIPSLRALQLPIDNKISAENLQEVENEFLPFTKFVFIPFDKRGVDVSEELSVESSIKRFQLSEDKCRRLEKYADIQQEATNASNRLHKNAEESHFDDKKRPGKLKFLGTGSMVPSKYRNVSCILLEVPESQHTNNNTTGVLLDCGEGSLGQLFVSSASYSEFCSTLRNIRLIFLSHKHADHHLGIFSFLRYRHQLWPEEEPPIVVAPRRLSAFLRFWNRAIEMVPHKFITCEELLCQSDAVLLPPRDVGKNAPQLRFKVCRVDHVGRKDREESYACRLDQLWENDSSTPHSGPAGGREGGDGVSLVKSDEAVEGIGKSWVYSGDCRPSPSLIEMGLGCEVLIHEATFESTMIQDAIARRHSTVKEAVEVAEKMKARHLVLTHFSQRYPKLPILEGEDASCRPFSVIFAFDFLVVEDSCLGTELEKVFDALRPQLLSLEESDV